MYSIFFLRQINFYLYPPCFQQIIKLTTIIIIIIIQKLTKIACASQVMCWVAQGKIDAYVSWDLNAWDIAAGMIIVEESGGILRNFDGTVADVSSRDMIVSRNERGSIHSLNEELRLVLAANGCLEY